MYQVQDPGNASDSAHLAPADICWDEVGREMQKIDGLKAEPAAVVTQNLSGDL